MGGLVGGEGGQTPRQATIRLLRGMACGGLSAAIVRRAARLRSRAAHRFAWRVAAADRAMQTRAGSPLLRPPGGHPRPAPRVHNRPSPAPPPSCWHRRHRRVRETSPSPPAMGDGGQRGVGSDGEAGARRVGNEEEEHMLESLQAITWLRCATRQPRPDGRHGSSWLPPALPPSPRVRSMRLAPK
eukprot:355656-Chlamydomonas_euryale.AAC.5